MPAPILLALALCALAPLACVSRDPPVPPALPDQVHSLPGWDGALPSRWFSGFVSAGVKDGKQLNHHYVLIESESASPDTDPVVVWSNGGPGAPSVFGLMVELGPLVVSGDSLRTRAYLRTKIPTLFRNAYSWSSAANLLILNGPPPVGFSYCDPPGPRGAFTSCGSWNDSNTAFHNAVAIQQVLERHPRLLAHDWYFTGESYAGIYIPTLVRELQRQRTPLRIKGMMMGNACMGSDVLCFSAGDVWWRVLFLRGHGQISEKSFLLFDGECGADARLARVSSKCQALAASIERTAQGFYEYDVYSECAVTDFGVLGGQPRPQTLDKCGGDEALSVWTARRDVRAALNVAVDSTFCSGDNGAGFEYQYTERDLRPFYLQLAKQSKVRLLVYNGDTDVSVNYLASQNWTAHLGLKEVEAWRSWTLDGARSVGGFITRYQGLDFVTIRGSGHMVPQYKPRAAFVMLTKFLANEPLPSYVAKPAVAMSSTNMEVA